MVDHLNVSYLYKKCDMFYFNKLFPCDLKSYYKSDCIVICLKTNQMLEGFLLALIENFIVKYLSHY